MYRILFVVALTLPASLEATCPDLTLYYPGGEADWPALEQQLAVLMPACLQNAEFFALYGAAQLNSGQVVDAIEALERALLLDPDQGAAQIDYAQALYLQGQLFSALELNTRLLERQDLPADLQPLLQQRQNSWQALTRQRSVQLDLLVGYDENLNGAPDPSRITLTLSGEPVLLTLNSDSQPVSGPYLNARLSARFLQLAPRYQQNWTAEVRGRISEDSDSDLIQLHGGYSFIRPGRDSSWQLNAGMNNLFFGGKALYTATEASARYQPRSRRVDRLPGRAACNLHYNFAAQHQFYHDQSQLNALEAKASAGVNCPLGSSGNQFFGAELGLLANQALKSTRLGGDRRGWQATVNWQYVGPSGVYRAQLNHTQLNDRSGYSPLLANGAKRNLGSSYVLLQYRRQLGTNTTLLINLYHQRQRSNIELFRTVNSTFEVGLSLAL